MEDEARDVQNESLVVIDEAPISDEEMEEDKKGKGIEYILQNKWKYRLCSVSCEKDAGFFQTFSRTLR